MTSKAITGMVLYRKKKYKLGLNPGYLHHTLMSHPRGSQTARLAPMGGTSCVYEDVYFKQNMGVR
jgi:hypothetical protein